MISFLTFFGTLNWIDNRPPQIEEYQKDLFRKALDARTLRNRSASSGLAETDIRDHISITFDRECWHFCMDRPCVASWI
jgi:hypothetical protein